MILVAWRILTHEAGRSALAISGIFVAVLMVFLQLGFFSSVPSGGLMIYDHMRYDLMMTSSAYVFQGQAGSFPRRRIYEALANPQVASVSPVYQGSADWNNEEADDRRLIFVIGFSPDDPVFDAPDLNRQLDVLRRPDTILVDNSTYPMFGKLYANRVTELNDRTVTVGGTYTLGIGFMGLGIVMVSDQNFLRLSPQQSLASVTLGLIRLKPGADPDAVAAELRRSLPDDTTVLTRAVFDNNERSHWVEKTSTGIIFGFGVAVAVIVGIVILYQTLATQVARQLPQYATLKAMGYSDLYLGGIIVALALLMALIAFVPAFAAATGIYRVIHNATRLPIFMTGFRFAAVFCLTVLMAAASALQSVRILRRADPADLF